MRKTLHNRLMSHTSPFARAAATAYVIGVADIIAVVADIGWLAGDMTMEAHWYHKYVAMGLVLALIAMIISFLYLYLSINAFFKKTDKIKEDREEELEFEKEALLLEQYQIIDYHE